MTRARLFVVAVFLSCTPKPKVDAAELQQVVDQMFAMQNAANDAHLTAMRTCEPLQRGEASPEELALVSQAVAARLRELPRYSDPDLAAYVKGLGSRIAKCAGLKKRSWAFELLDDPDPRSRSSLDGAIFINSGLLALARNEAQVAVLIAHELAHVDQQHAAVDYRALRVGVCERVISAEQSKSGDEARWAPQMRSLVNGTLDFANEPEFAKWFFESQFSLLELSAPTQFCGAADSFERQYLQSCNTWRAFEDIDLVSRLPGGEERAKQLLPQPKPRYSGSVRVPPLPPKLKWPK